MINAFTLTARIQSISSSFVRNILDDGQPRFEGHMLEVRGYKAGYALNNEIGMMCCLLVSEGKMFKPFSIDRSCRQDPHREGGDTVII